MYVSEEEIYGATSLDNTVVSEANIRNFIKAAEKDVDRITFTTYWSTQLDKQTAADATDNTIVVSGASWTRSTYKDMYVWVYSGTGAGQIRKITSNTSTTITVDRDWETNPVSGDNFRVFYSATDPYYNESEDGTNDKYFFVPEYPIQLFEELNIKDTDVSTDSLYIYKKIGKIQLSSTSERHIFDDYYPQNIDLKYWWGVYPVPEQVHRAVVVLASLKTLAAQTGGTYNVPSTYSLPEGSVTIGQAYINIRETFNMLKMEWEMLAGKDGRSGTLVKYPRSV